MTHGKPHRTNRPRRTHHTGQNLCGNLGHSDGPDGHDRLRGNHRTACLQYRSGAADCDHQRHSGRAVLYALALQHQAHDGYRCRLHILALHPVFAHHDRLHHARVVHESKPLTRLVLDWRSAAGAAFYLHWRTPADCGKLSPCPSEILELYGASGTFRCSESANSATHSSPQSFIREANRRKRRPPSNSSSTPTSASPRTQAKPLWRLRPKCRQRISPNVSQGGRGAAKSSSIRQRSELNIRKSSYGPSPADLLAVLSPNVSIFCQGKTEHSPNRPAYPNSSGYSLPFSSAELRLATAGAPGGTAPGKDSPSTATPRPCVR